MTFLVNSGRTQKHELSALSLHWVVYNQVLRHLGSTEGAGAGWIGAGDELGETWLVVSVGMATGADVVG